MTPNKQNPPSYLNRVAEFERDQKKTSTPASPTVPTVSSGNPYLQARIDILSKMKEWRRNEIKEMELTGNTDNRFYLDFVHEVAILGDKYDSQKSKSN